MLYPWQVGLWEQWQPRLARLPHALAITGSAGIGKWGLARHLSAALLCEAKGIKPCEQCPACYWFAHDTHPDFRQISPFAATVSVEQAYHQMKTAGAVISIEAIRELQQFIALSTHRRGWRVCLVVAAELMNVAAANALLKMLEEPPPYTLFILVTDHWPQLLPTIRSRCCRWTVPLPPVDMALAWLKQQNIAQAAEWLTQFSGAPLLVLTAPLQQQAQQNLVKYLLDPFLDDGLILAESLEQQVFSVAQCSDFILRWLCDLLSVRLGGPCYYFPQHAAKLSLFAKQLDPLDVMRYADSVFGAKQLARHPLNRRLVFEQLLLGYRQQLLRCT